MSVRIPLNNKCFQPTANSVSLKSTTSHYPVRLLYQVLGVVVSGYYAWQHAHQPGVSSAPAAWETALVKVFEWHKRRYGTRRLQVAVRQKGHQVGRQRLRAAMRRRGPHALQPKVYTPRTTDSTHGLRCAPNRLLNQLKPTQANQMWGSDITYLPLANGDWAYLCAYQDLVSKRVLGLGAAPAALKQVSASMPENLITSALQRAFWAQLLTPGLVVHSDRGGQYCGKVYRQLLHDHDCLRSQSRRGDCYDNAQAENRLKVFVSLVAPQNRSARAPRATRVCGLSRRPGQRR